MTEMKAWVFYPLISRLPISPLHLHVWHALHLLHVLLGCLFGCIVIFSNYLVPSFFGGAKAALGSCCTNFLIITIMNFIRREKISGGALLLFLFGHLKTIIIDTAMKLPHCLPQCIPLQVEPRLLPAKGTFSIYLPYFFKQDNSSVFLVMFSSF